MASQANRIVTPETLGKNLPTAIYRPEHLEVQVTAEQEKFFRGIVNKINHHPWPFCGHIEVPEDITLNVSIPGKRGGGITNREMLRESEGRCEIPLHVFQNRIFSPRRVIFTPTGRLEADRMSEYMIWKAEKDLLFLSREQFRIGLRARNTHENFAEVTSLLVDGKELKGTAVLYDPIPGPILSIVSMTEYHGRRTLLEGNVIPENWCLLPLLKRGPVIIFMEPLPYRSADSERIQWMLDTNACTHLASILQVNLNWMQLDPKRGELRPGSIAIGRSMHRSLQVLNADKRCQTLGMTERHDDLCVNRIGVVNASLGVINANLGELLYQLNEVAKRPQPQQQQWLAAARDEPMRGVADIIGFVRWRSDVEAVEYEQAPAPHVATLRLPP